MTLQVLLPPELQSRLAEEAKSRGLSPEAITLNLLDRHLPSKNQQANLVDLLQSWIDAPNVEEQKETGEFLIRSLDEDRLSNRQLFPENLKGVTW